MVVQKNYSSDELYSRLAVHSMTIRAIVVEPSGVLYDPTSRRRWLWQLVTRLGMRRSYDDFIRPWNDEYLPPVHRGERLYSHALRAFLQSLSLTTAQLNEIEAAMPLRGQPLETGVRPLYGVSRTLSRLATRGIELAALSDCSLTNHHLKEQLDNLGLGGHFSAVASSIDLGTIKPARKNYEAIACLLNTDLREIAFVSCTNNDLAGAAALGIRTVAIQTESTENADAVLPSFARLNDLITTWSTPQQKAA